MNKASGLKRVVNAAGYSLQGIRSAFVNEAAFRQELMLALVLVPAAFFVGHGGVQIALLVAVVLLVLVVELLNSAIEAVVDRIGEEHHELAGRAKDMGSAAVLISLCLAAIVWLGVGFQNFT